MVDNPFANVKPFVPPFGKKEEEKKEEKKEESSELVHNTGDTEAEAEMLNSIDVNAKKAKILAEYGGIRSNVPITHPTFWKL